MTHTHTQRRVRAQIRRRRINATRRCKQARGQRKRAGQKAERDYRWRLTQITDPIEIVQRVLMARGLPDEIARYIIFTHGALKAPTASFLNDPDLQAFGNKLIDPNWAQPVHPNITRLCGCPPHIISRNGPLGADQRINEWCINQRVNGGFPQLLRQMSPIKRAIAVHTSTCHCWRGTTEDAPRLMNNAVYMGATNRPQTQPRRDDRWEQRKLYGRYSLVENPTLCATTHLYYTLFANIHQLPPLATPGFYNREFSLTNFLQNASTQNLHSQLVDAYPAPRGHHIADRIGLDRERIIRYLLKS
jgi:hypothetical protein